MVFKTAFLPFVPCSIKGQWQQGAKNSCSPSIENKWLLKTPGCPPTFQAVWKDLEYYFVLILSNLFGAVRKRQPSDCLSPGPDLQEYWAPWTLGNARGSGGTQHLQYKQKGNPFPISATHWLILLYKLPFLLIIRTTSLPLLNIPTPPGLKRLIHFTCLFLSWSSPHPSAQVWSDFTPRSLHFSLNQRADRGKPHWKYRLERLIMQPSNKHEYQDRPKDKQS